MTIRSESAHRFAEWKVKLQMLIAGRLFSTRSSGLDGLVKKVMKANKPANHDDPDLHHERFEG